jgi:hypothetical protein
LSIAARPRIKFPPPSDLGWDSLEKTLSVALQNLFPQSVINRDSTTILANKLDEILYQTSLEHFGVFSVQNRTPKGPNKKIQAALRSFRKQKKELKRAWKQLSSSSTTNHASKALASEWRRLMKEHNRLARSAKRFEENKRSANQQRQFNKDPFLFSRKLFEKKCSGEPQFSAEQAFNFFAKGYRDENRDTSYSALEGMVRPDKPSLSLSVFCPSLAELKASAWQKRNGAAPGLDGLSYVLYKRCPCILPVVHKIVQKVWSTKNFPTNWATAFIHLLPKSQNLTEPSEFRPIALTNTVSKIFLSVVGRRLESFMVKNNYISSVQKGFKADTPGCLEHSFLMFEALFDAKMEQRQS